MAATLITRLGGVAAKYLKPIATTAIVLSPDGSNRFDVSTSPTISTGAGAPTEASPDGSLYTDTGGTTAANTLYLRIGGAWVAMVGT